MNISSIRRKGFTLVELMVAVVITTVIVTLLVYITSIAMNTWQRSRAEVRASNQGKAMVDSLARDFEAMVSRRGNAFEWLYAEASGNLPGPDSLKSTSAADLIFFTAATDRYDGKIGTKSDMGGDVSAVTYRLAYRDPILKEGGKGDADTFALYRALHNPDETFKEFLGKPDLKQAFSSHEAETEDLKNYVCENVYQFTVTFNVEVAKKSGNTTQSVIVPLTVSSELGDQNIKTLRLLGTGIDSSYSGSTVTADELKSGRIRSVSISLTVLSDFAIEQMRTRKFPNEDQRTKFFNEHSFQFTKLVDVPGA